MTLHRILSLTSAATALLLAAGCSSGGTTSSSTGTSGGGSTAASTSTSSSSSSGAPPGTYAYCIPSGGGSVTTCFAFAGMGGMPVDASAVCAADTENAMTWTPVPSCTFPGLVGCCETDQIWQCFYSAANDPQSTCTMNGYTWSATSP